MRAALLLFVAATTCVVPAYAQRSAVADAGPVRAGERAALVRELAADFGDEAIDPRVLDAIGTVPRHRFVPASHVHVAYQNRPLPIGHGQTISQPYIVAL